MQAAVRVPFGRVYDGPGQHFSFEDNEDEPSQPPPESSGENARRETPPSGPDNQRVRILFVTPPPSSCGTSDRFQSDRPRGSRSPADPAEKITRGAGKLMVGLGLSALTALFAVFRHGASVEALKLSPFVIAGSVIGTVLELWGLGEIVQGVCQRRR